MAYKWLGQNFGLKPLRVRLGRKGSLVEGRTGFFLVEIGGAALVIGFGNLVEWTLILG